MKLDKIDRSIVRHLLIDARMTNTQLAGKISLSQSACLRRVQNLEKSGVIIGYRAVINEAALGLRAKACTRITLNSQAEEVLGAFERQVAKCPNVISCDLMSGTSDYLLGIMTCDLHDYERIHKEYLSKLPGVARIETSFTLRRVVERPVGPGLEQISRVQPKHFPVIICKVTLFFS